MNRRQTARSRAGGVFACVACLVWSILSRASDDDVPTKDARRLLATVSLAARANGLQAVPQRDDTWLFRRPGGPLMARAFGPDVLVAWMRVGSDASVITDWNQHEVRTAAFEDSAGRAVLRWSLPSGPVWPAAMVRTKFASFLRDIERFDAAMNEALGLEETPNVEFLRGPQDCPPLDARGGRSVGFGPIGPGTIVIPLSRQPLVADPPIEQPSFVGHRTQVRALAGVDENGCPLVVFADSPVRWRVRDVLDVAVDGEREGPPTQPEMVVFAKREDPRSDALLTFLDAEGIVYELKWIGRGAAELAALRSQAEALGVELSAMQPLPVVVVGRRFVVGATKENVPPLFDGN